jgi:hypothetical protein
VVPTEIKAEVKSESYVRLRYMAYASNMTDEDLSYGKLV